LHATVSATNCFGNSNAAGSPSALVICVCKNLSVIITNNPHTPTVLDGLTVAKTTISPPHQANIKIALNVDLNFLRHIKRFQTRLSN